MNQGVTAAARRSLAAGIAATTALGFTAKIFGRHLHGWVSDCGAGVLYVVFWILVVLWIRPTLAARRVALGVVAVTCALEVLQLWHPAPLEVVRSTFLGHALLGSSFSWWDFPHYAAGGVLGALLARRLQAGTPTR